MKHGGIPFCLLLFSLFFFENLQTFAQPRFTFQGTYSYQLNHPYRDILDVTPDGKYGVTLTSVISPNNGGQITSFDPLTGTQIDTEFVGFGAATMKLVKLTDGVRVVVLTTQGGPRKITIYDLNESGVLTFRAATQITTSSGDVDSNILLSASGRVGFTRSILNDTFNQIISFSLDDGSVLSRLNTFSSSRLSMYEDADRRIIVSASGGSVVFINAANPSQLVSLGRVDFPITSGGQMTTLFSKNGQYVFVAGGPSTLSAIDTITRQIVGELTSTAFALSQIRIFDDGNSRLLAMRLAGPQNGFILVDASNPANLTIANQVNFETGDVGLSDFTFSRNGDRLFFAESTKITAFSIPNFTTVWETPLSSTQSATSITTFGQPERILAAYGSNNNFAATIFSFPNRTTPFDFDGDGKTEIGIFRQSDGSWWYARSSGTDFRVYSFGGSTDIMTPGDYTGDGKTDLSVFRPSNGEWYVQRSEDNSYFSFPFGQAGDIAVPADFDADRKTDAAIFRPSTGTWYILNSGGSGTGIVNFGNGSDKPVPADFDGDGKADIAIFRPSDGSWWYLRSSDSQFRVFTFGVGTDIPVPGDYSGDGKADLAIFRPSTGEWFFQRSEDNSYYSLPFGAGTDIPAPGDYDGDGKYDMAVFRPSTGNWFVQGSSSGTIITSFGSAGDRPISNAFVR